MALTLDYGRQDILAAKIALAYDTLADDTGVVEIAVNLPAGALVVGGFVVVTEVFDSTTSDALDVGDDGDPDRYSATPIDLQTLGATALDITGYQYTASNTIDVAWTAGATGTATQGTAVLVVEYIINGRSAFVQK